MGVKDALTAKTVKKKKNPVVPLALFSECCLVIQAELEKSSATDESSHF